ncbi:hypothetical protein TRFO_04097 [Tritrichomonas foetus]|uniref:UDENN domain-containing protein n=1 Tax=Tritrichomonas foetus TaxID=1144522 RepID=A0A1J4KNY6_9EUKA|nr:hypothetical protein TRFO_04097 [Tritrichomonas foetus]|eukprot:OHT11133.1 hypothetical protein TRFO_04097 [Tritrichomonas foetus]
MLNFHQPHAQLFDYILRVEQKDGSFERDILYQKTEKLPDAITNIGMFCFPYKTPKKGITSHFSFSFTDVGKNTSYVFVSVNLSVAFCIVSHFYHPKFLTHVITQISKMKPEEYNNSINRLLEMDLKHESNDWYFESYPTICLSSEQGVIKNLTPSSELLRLYQFLLTKLPIPYILSTIVAMTLDCKIIVVSSDLSKIGETIFALLALVYPLPWPGTFIPILPSAITATLEAPFAYIIGIHSSEAEILLSLDRYFVVNIDAHYATSVGMDDFPPNIMNLITTKSEKIKNLLNQYSPLFPFARFQKKIRSFIRDFFGVAFDVNSDIMANVVSSYNLWKSDPSDNFSAILSQSQLFDNLITLIDYEPNEQVIHAFWPNEQIVVKQVKIEAVPPSPKEDKKHIRRDSGGLPYNKKKSIDAQQAAEILGYDNKPVNQDVDDILPEVDNDDNLDSSDDEEINNKADTKTTQKPSINNSNKVESDRSADESTSENSNSNSLITSDENKKNSQSTTALKRVRRHHRNPIDRNSASPHINPLVQNESENDEYGSSSSSHRRRHRPNSIEKRSHHHSKHRTMAAIDGNPGTLINIPPLPIAKVSPTKSSNSSRTESNPRNHDFSNLKYNNNSFTTESDGEFHFEPRARSNNQAPIPIPIPRRKVHSKQFTSSKGKVNHKSKENDDDDDDYKSDNSADIDEILQPKIKRTTDKNRPNSLPLKHIHDNNNSDDDNTDNNTNNNENNKKMNNNTDLSPPNDVSDEGKLNTGNVENDKYEIPIIMPKRRTSYKPSINKVSISSDINNNDDINGQLQIRKATTPRPSVGHRQSINPRGRLVSLPIGQKKLRGSTSQTLNGTVSPIQCSPIVFTSSSDNSDEW